MLLKAIPYLIILLGYLPLIWKLLEIATLIVFLILANNDSIEIDKDLI